ncbi:MAG: IS21 family transposase [Thermoanaerobaculia bacterium]
MLLREYLEQGISKTALAARLGISRGTIHHWIRAGQLDRDLDGEAVRYQRRAPGSRKLDGYRGIVDCRLEEFPRLSATRIFEELRQAGYAGGYTQVKEYVRAVRPREAAEPIQRFETPPGHQAQVDFAHFRLPWGRRWALLVVLGYSRLLWVRFFERQDSRALFEGLEQAFAFFGGVPREILFDQMRSVVVADERCSGGRLIENPELFRFARHWGFRVRACRPYRARTKGKVERPIRYLRGSFFYGRRFAGDDDLNGQAAVWLDEVANTRRHRTTEQRPIDRFECVERAALGMLAQSPYRALVPSQSKTAGRAPIPATVCVERRSLETYSQLTEAGR